MDIHKEADNIAFEDKFYTITELSDFLHISIDDILRFIQKDDLFKEHSMIIDNNLYIPPVVALCIIYKTLEDVKVKNLEMENKNNIVQMKNDLAMLKLQEMLSKVDDVQQVINDRIEEAESMLNKVRNAFNISEFAEKIVSIEYYRDPISWN